MLVVRGRAGTRERDRAVTGAMLDRAAAGERALRVWTPHRCVAFGRRDVRAEGFEAAARAVRERGFPPVERRVGGRAVACTGTTVAFVRAEPVDEFRRGLRERYEAVTGAVQRALWRLGVPARRGEPADAFCPGSHSLSQGGKLAGVAQRVRTDAALVGGVLVVDGHAEIAAVLDAAYGALGAPFDPDAVGSVERAGGRAEVDAVTATLEDRLVGDAEREPIDAADLPE